MDEEAMVHVVDAKSNETEVEYVALSPTSIQSVENSNNKSNDNDNDNHYDEMAEANQWATKKRAESFGSTIELRCDSGVFVQSLGHVDSTNQTFQCEFEFHFSRQLSENEIKEYESDPNSFNAWVPYALALGAKETITRDLVRWTNNKPFFIKHDDNWDCLTAQSVWIFNVVFTEILELQHFPFGLYLLCNCLYCVYLLFNCEVIDRSD